jgi:hypothetical protein
MKVLDTISWPVVLVLCLTLGLAPYVPEPHVWAKLQMLLSGSLSKPLDIFDFVFHGVPWLILAAKAIRGYIIREESTRTK